ncbi:MAG: selenocysteine-specific translation elongation factor [Pseudomonadota bacterium]
MLQIRRCVLGTAGHVDHGKTALVKALTGVDTDRLDEEKRRGITIELGFATWPLREDLVASIVDVPGHERFVRTMAAGASGLDAVLLVIAADDGVMPQTREHLHICQLLGVRRGLVVISKSDLVDAELLELVAEDVNETVRGTFLEDAPVLACSALSGQGLPAVADAVRATLDGLSQRPDSGPAYLSVDRVFHKAGFGCVATGTLLTGRVRVGDSLEALPGPRGELLSGLRVRGLQVQDREVEQVPAGVRVALNLRGEGSDVISRGMALASAGWQQPTAQLHVEIQLLEGVEPVDGEARLSLHLGADDVLVRAIPLGQRRVEAGARAPVRLVADRPVAAFAGQYLVLRQPGRHGMGTVGGGRVLDPHPAAGKGSLARWARVATALSHGELAQRMHALLQDARESGASRGELARRLPPDEDLDKALAELEKLKAVVKIDGGATSRWVDGEVLQGIAARVLDEVGSYHAAHPALAGVTAAELRGQVPQLSTWLVERAVQLLVEEGRLERQDQVLHRPDHKVAQGAAGASVDALAALYQERGLSAPLDDEAREALQLSAALFRDALNELKRQGRLVRLADRLHVDRQALDAIRGRVLDHLAHTPQLSPADLKQLSGGLSRKYIIPLLEWLDTEGVTLRRGDVRVARSARR